MESARRDGRAGRNARRGRRARDARGNEPGRRGRSGHRGVRPHHVRRKPAGAVPLRARRLPLLAARRRVARRFGRGCGRPRGPCGPGPISAHRQGDGRHRAWPPAVARGPAPGALTLQSQITNHQSQIHMALPLSRDAAWQLLTEWTESDSLRKHALAVEAAVRGYARRFGEDEEAWGIVALLHDFDYERYPTPENHPFRGCEELQRRGYPDWVTRAILSHAEYSGVPRESHLEKTLFACDEMAGFVTAAALVRPTKSILDLEAPSVIKRMKDKAFARNVPRDHLKIGAEELGLPLETHVANVIAFMRERADALGLRGTE